MARNIVGYILRYTMLEVLKRIAGLKGKYGTELHHVALKEEILDVEKFRQALQFQQ